MLCLKSISEINTLLSLLFKVGRISYAHT
uniref:Uncharacterized protein n=1 Tax=Lepeophtheirus salmonis TaxID=72036 RepID=A0A0K2UFR0_LEPSM